MIPKDAKEGTVTIKNKTGKPLTIKVPEAWPACPSWPRAWVADSNGGNGIGGTATVTTTRTKVLAAA